MTLATPLDRSLERSRLAGEGALSPRPRGLYPLELTARCAHPDEVLQRARSVLEVVLRADPDEWPSAETWREQLPAWFTAACASEDRKTAWTLENFVYWFTPDLREWWWWQAEVNGPESFVIVLLSHEVDPPHEALVWLLRTAGATEIDRFQD
ncbi:MAG: hypothetical protein Q8N26_33585 [Myxococcales bacterium]|nr:hypothetical protein [Myxococcales bacterium]